jgi:hypothetical protein
LPARIDPELEEAMARDDARNLSAIVVTSDVDLVKRSLPKGVRIRHEFHLRPGLAITASPAELAAICDIDGVTALEVDREVRTQ